ncbi:MAG: ABC transporter substrate-binding protein, partial [Pseudomonadales bacterium]
QVLRGDYVRLQSYASGYGKFSNSDIKARSFDVKQASRWFEKAGYTAFDVDGIRLKNNKRLSFTVTYGQPHLTPRLAVLAEEAKKTGLELKLKQLDPSAAFKSMVEKKHTIAFMGFGTGFRPQYWEGFHSDNAHKPQTNSLTNTDDPLMDKLTIAYRKELDEDKRAALSRRIIARIHDLCAFIPAYAVPYTREAFWGWLKFPPTYGTRSSEAIASPLNSGGFVDDGGLLWIDTEAHSSIMSARRRGEKFEPQIIIDKTWQAGS